MGCCAGKTQEKLGVLQMQRDMNDSEFLGRAVCNPEISTAQNSSFEGEGAFSPSEENETIVSVSETPLKGWKI